MKNYIAFFSVLLVLTSCKNELTFEEQTFLKSTTTPCKVNCPEVSVIIPFAKDLPIVADSINKKVFSVVKNIIYFGEKPYNDTNYNGIISSFITSYENLKKKFPEDTFGWEAKIDGSVKYQSDSILNIEIKHYTFTGGAHGYQGLKSLLFNPKTGKSIERKLLFKDENVFKAFAEKTFRIKYNIPENQAINSTGLQFEDEVFQLPLNVFFTEN